VFSFNEGMDVDVLKKLAAMVSEYRGSNDNSIDFVLMRTANTCLRGSPCRNQLRKILTTLPADLVIDESHNLQ
jgi:hypothetical protein